MPPFQIYLVREKMMWITGLKRAFSFGKYSTTHQTNENEDAIRSRIFFILNSLSFIIALASFLILLYDRANMSTPSGYIFLTYRPYAVLTIIVLNIFMYLVETNSIAALAKHNTYLRQINRYVLVAIFCIATIFCTWFWGPSLPATLLVACFTATVAGLLLNGRTALLIILTIAGILVLGVNNESDPTRLESWRNIPITYIDIIMYSGIIAAIAIISWFANRQIWLMLRRAQASEHELELERNSLEIKVAERTREIKDLQMRQMEYLASQAQVGEMARGMFHDLLNPLTSVSLYVEEITKPYNRSAEANREANVYIQKAITSAKKMRGFLESVGKHVSSVDYVQIFSPCSEIQDAILLMSYKARNKGVALRHAGDCCMENKDIRMSGNPLNFHRIILNLISNAIDACGQDQQAEYKIEVNVKADESNIKIQVSDNGTGISREDLLKIFELNWSGKSTSEQRSPHAGLGLSLVKHMVERGFGGKIEVESQTAGSKHGTTFSLTFLQTIYSPSPTSLPHQ